MINIKADLHFQFNPTSPFTQTANGVSAQLNKDFIDKLNQQIQRIAMEGAVVTESLTTFSYFRKDWTSKIEYGGLQGLASKITIYNKRSGRNVLYKSKVSNSNKTYRFPVSYAIAMLEAGRKSGYDITPKTRNF